MRSAHRRPSVVRSSVLVVVGLALVACSTSSSSSPSGASREEARAYARGAVSCATDSDCCVVIDGCINQALVVRAADSDKVAALVAQPDPGGCTGCLLPAVQVACVAGQCAGTLVDPSADAGAAYSALTKDHCGIVPGVVTKTSSAELHVRALLGCGPQ